MMDVKEVSALTYEQILVHNIYKNLNKKRNRTVGKLIITLYSAIIGLSSSIIVAGISIARIVLLKAVRHKLDSCTTCSTDNSWI